MNPELIQAVENWATARGIFKHGTPEGQAEKTLEEAEELIEAIKANDFDGTLDAIGDIIVTLIIQAKMQGLTIERCVQAAYDEISKRKGVMKDGVFVKESDL